MGGLANILLKRKIIINVMNTHENYVNLETAKLLKEAGFDWIEYCISHSPNDEWHWEIPLHIAQKWLREVKNIFLSVYRMPASSLFDRYFCSIYVMEEDYDKRLYNENSESTFGHGKTYEDALESGIKECLTLILDEETRKILEEDE